MHTAQKHHLSLFTVAMATLVFTLAFVPKSHAQAEPFIGQISMFGGNFAPRNWALCDGQLLPISQHSALFSLLGTMYGGDGRTTFGLPDLRGRVPMHAGNGPGLSSRQLGQKGGVEEVTLTTAQMPSHNHTATTSSTLKATTTGGSSSLPTGNVLAEDGNDRIYSPVAPNVDMAAGAIVSTTTVANTGGNQPHTNVQPFQVVNFIIALQGIYPSRH